jgi:NAD(P)-dependent dehydrogenase (short-subunit alcohol dehydrogenase family)
MGAPDDIATAAVFLASLASGYMTGAPAGGRRRHAAHLIPSAGGRQQQLPRFNKPPF